MSLSLPDLRNVELPGLTGFVPGHAWTLIVVPQHTHEQRRMLRGEQPGLVCARCGVSLREALDYPQMLCLARASTLRCLSRLRLAYFDLPTTLFPR